MNEPKSHYTGLIKKYLSRLPLDPNGRIISLGEGQTPLIRLIILPLLMNAMWIYI